MADSTPTDESTQYLIFLNTRPVVELVRSRKESLSIQDPRLAHLADRLDGAVCVIDPCIEAGDKNDLLFLLYDAQQATEFERLINTGELGTGISSAPFFPALKWPFRLRPYNIPSSHILFFLPALDPDAGDAFDPLPVLRTIPAYVTLWRRLSAITGETTSGATDEEELSSILSSLELNGRAAQASSRRGRATSVLDELALSRERKERAQESFDLLTRVAEAESKASAAEAAAKSARREKVTLQKRVEELEEERDQMDKEASTAGVDVETLKRDTKFIRSQLARAQSEAVDARRRLADNEQKIEPLRCENGRLEGLVDALTNDQERAQQKYEELEKALEKALEEAKREQDRLGELLRKERRAAADQASAPTSSPVNSKRTEPPPPRIVSPHQEKRRKNASLEDGSEPAANFPPASSSSSAAPPLLSSTAPRPPPTPHSTALHSQRATTNAPTSHSPTTGSSSSSISASTPSAVEPSKVPIKDGTQPQGPSPVKSVDISRFPFRWSDEGGGKGHVPSAVLASASWPKNEPVKLLPYRSAQLFPASRSTRSQAPPGSEGLSLKQWLEKEFLGASRCAGATTSCSSGKARRTSYTCEVRRRR